METARALINSQVSGVVVANVGPNAVAAMRASGIQVFESPGGTVREALQAYRMGRLTRFGGDKGEDRGGH